MPRHVLLVTLADSIQYGGFVSYTTHLYWALRKVGLQPTIIKVRDKQAAPKPYADGLHYTAMPIEKLVAYTKMSADVAVHIVYGYWRGHADAIAKLLHAGATLTLHDPTEFKDEYLTCARRNGTRVVAIRPTNADTLSQKGLDVTYIPHPYQCTLGEEDLPAWDGRGTHAVSVSRLDFDKHIDIIVGANALLPPERRIQIYGSENRLYTYHKLAEAYPDWKESYRGKFDKSRPGAAVRLLQDVSYCVDMSAIKGDGGGTQYTFLEAIDAGAVIVLNRKWIEAIPQDQTPWRPGENCLVAGDLEELARIMRSTDDRSALTARANDLLAAHDPEVIGERYNKFFWGDNE